MGRPSRSPRSTPITDQIKDPKGFYAALGLSPAASLEDVRRAFTRKAKQVHPDHNANPDAKAAFEKLFAAYKTLRDPHERAARCC